MTFALFNTQNRYLTVTDISQKLLNEGVFAYITQAHMSAYFRAYQRANVGGGAGPFQTFMTQLWATRLSAPPAIPIIPAPIPPTPAAVIADLTARFEIFWTGTVRPGGQARLVVENTQRVAYYTVGAGAAECPDLDNFCKQPIANNHLINFSIKKFHMHEYGNFLVQKTTNFASPNNTRVNHKTYIQAEELKSVVATFTGTDDVTEGSPKYNRLIACSNFWQNEFSAIADRSAVATWMSQWGGAGNSDVMKRLVSDGEKADIETNSRFAQGPTSFERHKWFYFGAGAPGVNHARELKLVLNGTPITEMLARAEEVSDVSQKTSMHALLKKANEKDCIGIHEDLLEIFKARFVKTVSFTK